MPRRSRPSSRTDSPSSSKRLARIDSAFNTAAGYVDTATTTARAPGGLSAKARGKRRAVVVDDEDEEGKGMEAIQPSTAGGGRGFLLEGEEEGMQLDEAGPAEGGGGGFLPEPDFPAVQGGGGGFLPEDSNGEGGFILEPPAGGFVPDDSAGAGGGGFLADDSAAGGGFLPDPPPPLAGGFLPDPSADSSMPDASSSFADGTGGGFFASALPGDASFSGPGGFLLDDEGEETGDTSLELPTPAPLAHDSVSSSALPPPPDAFFSALGTSSSSHAFDFTLPPRAAPPPPPDRIPLHSIPSALRQLGLHNRGLPAAELLELFEDVASDDESLPSGGKSVRRERFREACEVLLGDEEDSEEEVEEEEGDGSGKDGKGDYRGEEDEDDAPVIHRRRQPARTTRSSAAAAKRSTRASRVVDEEEEEGGEEGDGAEVKEKDFGAQLDDLPSESSADEEDDFGEEEEDSDGEPLSSANKKSKKQPSALKATGGRTRRRRGRGGEDILLTDQDLLDAEDSFDLFFVDSVQQGKERGKRAIGLMELQRACRVLKEKLGEGELNEMLEYAARSKGKVDLEAFARILVETGL